MVTKKSMKAQEDFDKFLNEVADHIRSLMSCYDSEMERLHKKIDKNEGNEEDETALVVWQEVYQDLYEMLYWYCHGDTTLKISEGVGYVKACPCCRSHPTVEISKNSKDGYWVSCSNINCFLGDDFKVCLETWQRGGYKNDM